jgi:hypothetical protein
MRCLSLPQASRPALEMEGASIMSRHLKAITTSPISYSIETMTSSGLLLTQFSIGHGNLISQDVVWKLGDLSEKREVTAA